MAEEGSPFGHVDPTRDLPFEGGRAVLIGSVYRLTFLIPGEPVPKGRPQFGRGRAYTPEATRSYEDYVITVVKNQLQRAKRGLVIPTPFDRRIIATLRFNFERPSSLSKASIKNTKPDYDNLAKSVTDGLERAGVFTNDSRITDCLVQKRFVSDGHPGGVEVELLCW